MPICDRFGRECFKIIMTNTSLGNTCDCPLDCETTRFVFNLKSNNSTMWKLIIPTLIQRYSYGKSSKPIDIEKYCHNFGGYWHFHGFLPKFIRRFEEVIYGRNSSKHEHCIRNHRQNVAIVNIQIATSANDLINKIVKSPRVTTADILSNIGTYTITSFFKVC